MMCRAARAGVFSPLPEDKTNSPRRAGGAAGAQRVDEAVVPTGAPAP